MIDNPFTLDSLAFQAWEDGYHKKPLNTPQIIPCVNAYIAGSGARFEEDAILLKEHNET